MPGDWTLDLDYPICGIDDKPCPHYLSRCDMCEEKEMRKRKLKEKKTITYKCSISKEEVKMLKDLMYYTVKPDDICGMIAQINGVDLSSEKSYFERYDKGVYRHDGYIFNGDAFIKNNCEEKLLNGGCYGVCDNYEQVLEYHKDLLTKPNKNYVIILSTVERKKQSEDGECCVGWWLEYEEHKRSCPCWVFHVTPNDKEHFFKDYEYIPLNIKILSYKEICNEKM